MSVCGGDLFTDPSLNPGLTQVICQEHAQGESPVIKSLLPVIMAQLGLQNSPHIKDLHQGHGPMKTQKTKEIRDNNVWMWV